MLFIEAHKCTDKPNENAFISLNVKSIAILLNRLLFAWNNTPCRSRMSHSASGDIVFGLYVCSIPLVGACLPQPYRARLQQLPTGSPLPVFWKASGELLGVCLSGRSGSLYSVAGAGGQIWWILAGDIDSCRTGHSISPLSG
jgi:hypothetical protein